MSTIIRQKGFIYNEYDELDTPFFFFKQIETIFHRNLLERKLNCPWDRSLEKHCQFSMSNNKDKKTNNSLESIINQHSFSFFKHIECVLYPYATSSASMAYSLLFFYINDSRMYIVIIWCTCVLWSIQLIEQMKIKKQKRRTIHILTSAICW